MPVSIIHTEMMKGRVYSYLASNSQMDSTIQEMGSTPRFAQGEIEKAPTHGRWNEKTRRRVNGLEYATIPDLKETIYYIEMKLEEAKRQPRQNPWR